MSKRYPKTIGELPPTDFYAILKPKSVTIPGDKRSRQAPGHGYPEHSEESWDIEVFESKDEWLNEITKLETSGYMRHQYKAVVMKPAAIETSVSVKA